MEQGYIDELVNGILGVMRGQVFSIILFGSMARGDFDAESDVDIAIICSGKIDNSQEDAINDYFVNMDIKYGRFHSIIDIEKKEFDKWKNVSPFYKNVANEGVVLWKAA